MSSEPAGPNRFAQRRAHTRAALIAAAQAFIAEGTPSVPIQEVTARADVGIGSFYNHFASKEDLFAAAMADALEQYGDVLDALGSDLDDPAARFARSFRLTGRLHRRAPQLSRVLLSQGHEISRAADGIAPRARRDIADATRAGRFHADDLDRAMVVVAGSMLEMGHLLHEHPERDEASTVDGVTSDVLVALGMTRDEADAMCAAPLPEIAEPR